MAAWLIGTIAAGPVAPAVATTVPRGPSVAGPTPPSGGPVAAPAPAEPTTAPLAEEQHRRESARRTRPEQVEWAAPNPAAGGDPWRLFDDRRGVVVEPLRGHDRRGAERVRVRLRWSRASTVIGIGVWASGKGDVSILVEDGAGARPDARFTGGHLHAGERWQLVSARVPVETSSLLLEWDARRLGIEEITIWELGPAAHDVADAALADQLQTRPPPGAVVLSASPATLRVDTIALGSKPEAGTRISLGRDPRSLERAFLVYELEGLAHWTQVPRVINGQVAPAVRADETPREALGPSGLQVEEIPVASLRTGDNAITFLPPTVRNGSPGYTIRGLRLVGIPAVAEGPIRQGTTALLVDGDDRTGLAITRNSASSAAAELAFGAPIEPQLVSFRLSAPTAGTLTVGLTGGPQRPGQARAQIPLTGLAAGWHTVPLAGALPNTTMLRAVVHGQAAEASARGQVSELTVVGAGPPSPSETDPVTVTFPLHGECAEAGAFVRGFVAAVAAGARVEIGADGTALATRVDRHGGFGAALALPPAVLRSGRVIPVDIRVVSQDGAVASGRVEVGPCLTAPTASKSAPRVIDDAGAPFGAVVQAGQSATLSFAGATLEIPSGAVDRDVRVTMRPLPAAQVPRMDARMQNAVPDGRGFRLGPHGLTFRKPVKLTLPVAPERVPGGMAAARDVYTFFFDEARGRWQRLSRAEAADPRRRAVTSLTTHFTDFVVATITTPDHPGAERFDPTSIKDMQIGDPATGVLTMMPPGALPSGSARTALPIELPPGRNGMAPALAVDYDSSRRNGWLGQGWDLPVSAIEIDTRFGVPRYNGSEDYLLDGEAIRPLGPATGSVRRYARRAERAFERIERIGENAANFRWEVTDKSGTKRVYGASSGARLASYAGGGIFRWALERVTDPFENSIEYVYFTDAGNNGEPFRQLYLDRIDYTGHKDPRFAARYHVDFVRQTGRTDPVIDGRPGFQVMTRFLLDRVRVRFDQQLVREYLLRYRPGNFGKSLIASIAVTGLDGRNTFHAHSLEYFSVPEGPGRLDTLDLFTAPLTWGSPSLPGATHANTRDQSTVSSDHIGVGVADLNLGLGKSQSAGTEDVALRLLDVNGDALTDGLAEGGGLDVCRLIGSDVLNPAGLRGLFTSGRSTGLAGALGHTNRDYFGGEAGLFGSIARAQVSKSFKNRTRETRLLIDMNGDGFVDQFGTRLGVDGVGVRFGDDRGNFSTARGWPNHSLEHMGCEGPALLSNLFGGAGSTLASTARSSPPIPVPGQLTPGEDGDAPTLPDFIEPGRDAKSNLMRLLLPYSGTIIVQGAVGKAIPTPGTSAATIVKNDRVLWTHRLVGEDLTSCEPRPGSGCGGGLLLDVQAGDRLYFITTPIEGTTGDAIFWDPQVTYTRANGVALTAADQALREPNGTATFRFSQSEDFRVVGRQQRAWLSQGKGVLAVASVLTKLPTSDDVELRIMRRDFRGEHATRVFSRRVPAAFSGNLTLEHPPIVVDDGDVLTFEVFSHLPIDPARADWRPVVQYDQFCRAGRPVPHCDGHGDHDDDDDDDDDGDGEDEDDDDPDHDRRTFASGHQQMVCGKVQCPDAPVSDDPNAAAPVCTVGAGTRDPFPLPAEIALQVAPAFYPLFRFAAAPPTQSFVVRGSGSLNVDGTVVKRTRTRGRVVIAVQGTNKLFWKRVLKPDETGSFPVQMRLDGLQPDELVFFSIHAVEDPRAAVSWAPTVGGQRVAVNVRWRDPAAPRDPAGSGVIDAMGGGYHGWSFGEWNAYKPFDERAIRFDLDNPDPDFAPMVMEPAPPSDEQVQMMALAAKVSFGSIWNGVKKAAKAVGKAVVAVAKKVVDVAEEGAEFVKNAITGGLQLLGGFVLSIYDLFFCRQIEAVRLTETDTFAVNAGVVVLEGALSKAESTSRADVVDMNGDRYPDLVTKGGIRFNANGVGFQSSLGHRLPLGEVRHVRQFNVQGGVGLGGSPARNKNDGRGRSRGFDGATIGAGLNYGLSATIQDLADVNGDGLPDHVRSNGQGGLIVALNLGYRFSANMTWAADPWAIQQFSAREELADAFDDDLDINAVRVEDTAAARLGGGFRGTTGMVSWAASAGATVTLVRSVIDLLDVNGDGLPDQVMKHPDEAQLRVKLNLGGRFGAEKRVPLAGWGIPIDPVNLIQFGLGSSDALSFTTIDGYSGGGEGAGTFFIGPVPVTAGGAFSHEENDSTSDLRFEDVDGDGGADHVLKRPNASVLARLNKGGKANLLRRVTGPLGGSFELDYRREGNRIDTTRSPRVDMPQNLWALSSVKVNDGQGNAPLTFEYRYDAGGDGAFYDRHERESYGFSHVRTIRGDGSTLDEHFRNQTPFEKGLLAERIERERIDGPIVRRVVNTYEPRVIVPSLVQYEALVRRDTYFAEASTADVRVAVPSLTERFNYDAHGNVTFHADDGEGNDATDDVEFTVRYDQTELVAQRYIHRPTSVVARGRAGQVLRQRTAHYRADGAPDRIIDLLSGGKQPDTGAPYTGGDATNPRWSFGYDVLGNLTSSTDPKGFLVSYDYDTTVFTYRTAITEASPGFGYRSTATYDLRFGRPAEVVDVNGHRRREELDEFGRPVRIWGPNDFTAQIAAATPTVEVQYVAARPLTTDGTRFSPAAALTRHKDVARDPNSGDPRRWDPIDLVTFVDGLGRVIQTKKDVEKDSGSSTSTVPGMAVSGRVLFDSRGRIYKQGQAVFDTGAALGFVAAPLLRETTFQYDTLSRPRQVTTPDGAVTTTSHQLGTFDGRQRLLTLTRDALGKLRRTYVSVRDEIAGVQESNTINGALTTLTTRYRYNPLGELLSAQDTRGNVTTSEYDTLGHTVALTSPDAGRTEWRYDLAGNVNVKESANLRARGQLIRYRYDFSRLARVDYPDTQSVFYSYGGAVDAGDANGNRASRLLREWSEAGSKDFSYDRLGNVSLQRYAFTELADPGEEPPTIERELEYQYDSFGRLLRLTFAGESPEVVSYGYDRGGNVTSVRGVQGGRARDYLRFVGYDEFEQRTRVIAGNGVQTRYEYEPLTRRTSRVATDFQDAAMRRAEHPARPMQRLRFSYDLVGNVLELANEVTLPPALPTSSTGLVGPSRQTFRYDDLHQLVGADAVYRPATNYRYRHSLTLAYDQLGNITRKDQRNQQDFLLNDGTLAEFVRLANGTYRFDYHYDGGRPHAPSRIDEQRLEVDPAQRTFEYDGNGNQLAWDYDGEAGPSRAISWTAEDRIRSVSENGTEISRALYDGNGARTHHRSGGSTTLYFGPNLTLRDGEISTKHLFAAGVRLASRVEIEDSEAAPGTFWYHSDQLQSTQYVTDDAQNLVEHDEYFATGEPWTDESAPDARLRPRYLFNAKELDTSTKLYYYGARYYDPELSQWVSPDPFLPGYAMGMANGGVYRPANLSLYAYAFNNPVTLRDPDGSCPNCVTAGIGAAVGGALGGGGRMLSNIMSNKPVMQGVAASAIGGAVAGGLAGLTMGASLAATSVGAGMASTIGGGITRTIETGDAQMTPMNVSGDFAGGVLGVAGGAAVSKFAVKAGGAATARQTITETNEAVTQSAVSATRGGGGALRRVGDLLESVDDALANPQLLKNLNPADLQLRLGGRLPSGWRIEALGRGAHKGEGFVLRQYTPRGDPTGRQIRWHPGGGHHGSNPYWRAIDGNTKSDIIPGAPWPR